MKSNKIIEIDDELKIEKKQSFSIMKNQIKIGFLGEQQQKKRHQSARDVATKAYWLRFFVLIK